MRSVFRSFLVLVTAICLSITLLHTQPAAALSNYVVTNQNNEGEGSLRAAIISANSDGDDSVITFTSEINVVLLTEALPELANDLTLTINGGNGVVVQGNSTNFRIFLVASGANVTLSGVNPSRGRAGSGGGIYNNGVLTLNNIALRLSTSITDGGGIYNNGTLTLNNSTVYDNVSLFGNGGGIYNAGTLTLNNSTVSDNASGNGGGIYNVGGTITLNNSIIATSSGGDCVRNGGTINAQYSLIEDGLTCINGTNTSNLTGNPDLATNRVPNLGSPVINAGSNALVPVGVTNDLAGNPRIQNGTVDMGAYEYTPPTAFITLQGGGLVAEGSSTTFTLTRFQATTDALTVNLTVTLDPDLNASDYTLTAPDGTAVTTTATFPAGITTLVLTFTAINDGSSAENDERLYLSLASGFGYTFNLPGSATATILFNGLTVTNGNDSGEGSLRQAVANANRDGAASIITFSGVTTVTLTSSQLPLGDNGPLTINGAGVTVTGNNTFRIFLVDGGANVTLNGLTVRGGRADRGGGILNDGTLTLQNSTITQNASTDATGNGGGGGIHNSGTLTLNNSIVNANSADGFGGGIFGRGTIILMNSTLSDNTARYGGGVGTVGGTVTMTNSTASGNTVTTNGGGIVTNNGHVILNNSTVSGNTAHSEGGGVGIVGGTLTMTNSIVSGNTAHSEGGGVSILLGVATLNNSTVSGNSGGGIDASIDSSITLNNSIVANSTAGGDCHRGHSTGTINAHYSLIGNGLSCINGTNTNNLMGDPGLDSNLVPASATSIVVDRGSNALVPGGITTDLAGNPRIQGYRVDMGAFESPFSALPVLMLTGGGTVAEGSSTTFTLTRTEATTDALTVNLTLTLDTLTADDYTLTDPDGTVITTSATFPVGSASLVLTFSALDDGDEAEATETLMVALVSGSGYVVGSSSSATAAIIANGLRVTNGNDCYPCVC